MPMQNDFSAQDNEALFLLVAGQAHAAWEAYTIDSDLLTPADAWQFAVSGQGRTLPAYVKSGAEMQVRVGNDLVLTGRIDRVRRVLKKGVRTYQISGRDSAAQLVDCSAPVFVRKMSTLKEIVTNIVRPLGIAKVRMQTSTETTQREKINVEPGDTAWEVLRNAAEAEGLWPWFDPDGTLVIGGPDYTTPPVAVLSANPDDCNIESLEIDDDIVDRFSEITVLGQTHATKAQGGKHNLKGVAKDTGITWSRPKIVVDHETDTAELCKDRAAKLMGDSRLRAFEMQITVKGHRINAPGQPGDGMLWQPGQRVRVVSDADGIDAIYFLMARKFQRSRGYGTTTDLTLKEDGVWVVEAHPHKGKHRKGKNALTGEVIILDDLK
ncbi:phage baseplate assembly protein [Duganella sp. SG902]|uniref:phage baseplate assembly protein n=1 Tax=Duganella sp. SG902 TaxID=2587016 RepID=UPI001E60443C|nr:phage tail protein [Duganella sp. SG902]